MDQREKNSKLFEETCSPPMLGVEEAIDELERERKLDEARLEKKMQGMHRPLKSDNI